MEKDKETEDTQPKMCLVCKKEPLAYRVMPCRHEYLCRKCSMKMASGGKCKICHEFFIECQRIIINDYGDDTKKEEEED